MVATRAETENIERFTDRYRLCCSPVRLAIESDALGADYGSTGYTTRAQADELARHLRLGPATGSPTSARVRAGPACTSPSRPAATSSAPTSRSTDCSGHGRAPSPTGSPAEPATPWPPDGTSRSAPGRFDAVVHTDVLCCLGPKLAVLRACHRLLRPGGRLAFTTIHVAPDLDARRHRRAVRAGPWHVATRRPYPELVAQAGFHDIAVIDVTEDYARTQRAWLAANESRAADVRRLISDREFETAQADRRYAQAAIEEGLLRRSLITATRR